MLHTKLKIVHLINTKDLDKPYVLLCPLKLNVSTVVFCEEHSGVILRYSSEGNM